MRCALALALALALAACGGEGEPAPAASAGGASTPLPPEVARIVEPGCLSCHGDPPTSSAPQSLATLEAWRAPSPSDPAKSNGQLAIERMGDGLRPMPPTGGIHQQDLEALSDWVAAGMPAAPPSP